MEYHDILKRICDHPVTMTQMYICWECEAVLKKIKLFISRIEDAQRIMKYHILNTKKTFLVSLSRLSLTNTDNVICITHDDNKNDEPAISTVKEETTQCDDDIDFNQEDYSSYHCQEIKKETTPKLKRTKKNKSYCRIIYGRNIFKKSLLRKKFAIKPDSVPEWLQIERDSKYFSSFKFQCDMCIRGFHSADKLKKHNLESHDKSLGEYVCMWCKLRFAVQADLDAHKLTHEFAYECTQCGYRSYSVRRLNAHIQTHRSIQCLICDLCLPNTRKFDIHYKAMHSVFTCDHCGKRCTTKYMLEKHISRGHVTSHACSLCPRKYKSRSALNKHRGAKHSTSAPELAYCVRCDKQFDSELLYRRHVLNTTAHAHETQICKKRVPCPDCGNTYSRHTYMMNHYRHVHKNQSKHYCSQCDRHFLNRTRFVEHMRYNHEGAKREKNKLCNVCGRGFATNRILVNHIRTHSGERPFECEYCSARFTQKHSMLSHVKYIHLKSKRRTAWHH